MKPLLLQTWKIYLEKTFDPEISWHLWGDWQDKEIRIQRGVAAKACLEYIKQPDNGRRNWEIVKDRKALEDILDLFEDVGFFMKGHQLSDEMAQHYFGHWIIIYWMGGASDYVSNRRKGIEKSTWAHVEHAFERIWLQEILHCSSCSDSGLST